MGEGTAVGIESLEGQVIMPFYIVCDVSSSMSGDINALNDALEQLHKDIMADPVVDDLTMLSVISFNHAAHTEVALDAPSALNLPLLQASGGTSYGAAFHEFHRAFEADRERLKMEGKKVYRPCVFFLSDGEPNDTDFLTTFRSLFAYDPVTKQGNKAFPYMVTFGFRDATQHTMSSIAYPDFGASKGRWFIARQGSHVSELLKSMANAIGNTVLTSGRSAGKGKPQIVAPAPDANFDGQFGDAGDFV